jgi:hypothetical protein
MNVRSVGEEDRVKLVKGCDEDGLGHYVLCYPVKGGCYVFLQRM